MGEKPGGRVKLSGLLCMSSVIVSSYINSNYFSAIAEVKKKNPLNILYEFVCPWGSCL